MNKSLRNADKIGGAIGAFSLHYPKIRCGGHWTSDYGECLLNAG